MPMAKPSTLNYRQKPLPNVSTRGKTERPLLHGLHGDELVDFIAAKLAEREEFYGQATYIVNGIDMSVEMLADVVK